MRHHFHRCGNLRVVQVDASDLSHARKGGAQILEELCEARRLARCVGLAECEVLSPEQKRDLLVTRATRLREEEGGQSALADLPAPRAAAFEALRRDLVEEYEEIVEANRRHAAEAGAAVQRNPRPITTTEEHALAGGGLGVVLDDALRALRTTRLDAIERALEAMAQGRYGRCVRCAGEIGLEQLREAPDALLCAPCAREAFPDTTRPAWAE